MILRSLKITALRLLANLVRPWAKLRSAPIPPQTVFSSLTQVRRGERPGAVVLRSQKMHRFPATSMTVRSNFHQHRQQPWPIFWSHHFKAHLITRSLALLDFKEGLMIESAYGRFYKQDSAWNNLLISTKKDLLGSWTSIVSHWCPISPTRNYYHWLFDALPRLGCLKYFPSSTKVLVPKVVPAYCSDSLAILGLEGRYKPVDSQHLVVEDYYFSGLVGMTGCHNPYAVGFLRNSFLSHGRGSGYPRRFFVGRKQTRRAIQNNLAVESFFEQRGWPVIYLEDFSFQEQISLFRNADSVCALHGAALANLVWCQAGTFVLEIFPHNYLHGSYEGIAKINRLDYHNLVFSASINRRPWVDLDVLKKHLKGRF